MVFWLARMMTIVPRPVVTLVASSLCSHSGTIRHGRDFHEAAWTAPDQDGYRVSAPISGSLRLSGEPARDAGGMGAAGPQHVRGTTASSAQNMTQCDCSVQCDLHS